MSSMQLTPDNIVSLRRLRALIAGYPSSAHYGTYVARGYLHNYPQVFFLQNIYSLLKHRHDIINKLKSYVSDKNN